MERKSFVPNFKILDGIRGIAALYVVINHARGHLFIGGSELLIEKPLSNWSFFEKIYFSLLQFTTIGTEFVILFFVLSGFSIAYSLRNNQKVGKFYLKRFIRLYPPFLLALIWAFLVYVIIENFAPALNKNGISVFHNFKTSLLNLVYINKGNYIPQFWSLIHEVFFYLLIPIMLIKRKAYYILSTLFFLLGFFINESLHSVFYLFIFKYNLFFAIGVYLYYNYEFVKRYLYISNNWIFYTVLGFLFILTIIIKYLFSTSNNITYLLSSFGAIILIVNFLEKDIKNFVLNWLGEMSYTLYVTHFASIYFFYLFLVKINLVTDYGKIKLWWVWILSIPIILILSRFMYLVGEKPSKRFLIKLRKR